MMLVEADAGEEWDSRTDWTALALQAVQTAVASSDYAALGEAATAIEVSVRFTDDDEVRALNAAWRGKDRATNVLSFPMVERTALAGLGGHPGETLLGDIVLAHGVCLREAADKAVSVETHASHLVVHGTLHLLGYDHETGDSDAEAMEAIERAALARIGIADPYLITEVQP